jgi:hypothetical protein
VVERTVIANLGCLTDNDTHAMINKKSPTYPCAWMNLNSSQKARCLSDETSEPLETATPQPVGQAMDPDRV